MLRVGLIGFGSISVVHREAYVELKKLGVAELVCAYDVNPEAFEKKHTINLGDLCEQLDENINFYTDLDEMLEKEKIDFVDICIPTFLHSEMATSLLMRGYHVMCEKPMAFNREECEKMLEAAENSGKELMIGQCLRFYPAFDYIKEAVDDGRFGRVLGGYFERLSSPPDWGWENWFMTPERSGGCITDLHIHDIDIIRYLFGEPEAVSCRASSSVCVYDTVHTSLFYKDFPITAVGDWTLIGMPFRGDCRIQFERATVEFRGFALTVYPKDGGESFAVPLENTSPYFRELLYFCRVILGEIKNEKNSARSAANTIALIDSMKKSADASGKVIMQQ